MNYIFEAKSFLRNLNFVCCRHAIANNFLLFKEKERKKEIEEEMTKAKTKKISGSAHSFLSIQITFA